MDSFLRLIRNWYQRPIWPSHQWLIEVMKGLRPIVAFTVCDCLSSSQRDTNYGWTACDVTYCHGHTWVPDFRWEFVSLSDHTFNVKQPNLLFTHSPNHLTHQGCGSRWRNRNLSASSSFLQLLYGVFSATPRPAKRCNPPNGSVMWLLSRRLYLVHHLRHSNQNHLNWLILKWRRADLRTSWTFTLSNWLLQ